MQTSSLEIENIKQYWNHILEKPQQAVVYPELDKDRTLDLDLVLTQLKWVNNKQVEQSKFLQALQIII